MPFLTASTFDLTNDEVIDVVAAGIRWNVPENRTITVAVADGLNDTWVDRELAIESFAQATDSFEAFIDVTFDYIGFFESPVLAGEAGADIVFTLERQDNAPDTFASAFYPGPGVFNEVLNYATEDGDIYLNFANSVVASSSFQPGSDGFYTIIHEFGHALGLKHPFEVDFDRPALSDLMRDDLLNVEWYSIMSYTDPFPNQLERWDPASPMLLDVLALQYMYGINTTTHAGDTTHVLPLREYQYSLWDASGSDIIAVSEQPEGWVVQLPNVQYTPLVDVLAGYALPAAQFNDTLNASEPTQLVWLLGDLESVTGSDFADQLHGNDLANVILAGEGDDQLEGSAGDDVLNGESGVDAAHYAGVRSTYTVTYSAEGTVVQDRRSDQNSTGTDELQSIETLVFNGGETSDVFDLRDFGGPTGLSAAALESFIELYIAYFNRAPDALGLWFWGNAFANGTSLEDMAALFIDQDETRDTYGPDLSNTQFATAVYDNVLGRGPDMDGLAFWEGALSSGAVSRDQFILEVLRGAKADPDMSLGQDFIDQQLADQAYLATKTDLGALFAVHRGMSDVANASAALSLYDGSDNSVTATVSAIEDFYVMAQSVENGELLLPLVGVLDTPFDMVA